MNAVAIIIAIYLPVLVAYACEEAGRR